MTVTTLNMSPVPKFRKRLYEIIFEADTRAGKLFDLALLVIILISIGLVMLESINRIQMQYSVLLKSLEWAITFIFTIEYIARVWVVEKPVKYILSFYGIIDLLAILPSFLGLFLVGGHSLIVIRALRLLRVFRVLKLGRYTRAGRLIASALWQSREKIIVFILFVLTLSVIIGTLMYLIEGEQSGFTDIPTSIYWAIVTLTTVGYGDLSPATGLGQFLASFVMILGYSIIAVPTGIVTASLINRQINTNTQVCPKCMYDKHDDDALFCKKCGESLKKD
jgi:voltage-gated potassium channel